LQRDDPESSLEVFNIPVVYAGRWVMDRIPLNYAKWTAFALFLAMAVITFSGKLAN
jgi:putative Ca2+/H+ antiporter (TMEM165/GDT1 family)